VDDDYGRSAADAASGCQPSASAAVASSQSGIPNAPPLTDEIMRLVRIELGVPPEGDLALHLRDRLKREAEPHP
jgi:hypothetical protein